VYYKKWICLGGTTKDRKGVLKIEGERVTKENWGNRVPVIGVREAATGRGKTAGGGIIKNIPAPK